MQNLFLHMQESRRLVSIIIPAYNAAAFVTETIQSVKQQTYPHWELIVVNDGSTDITRQTVLALNEDGIKLIDQQNAGVSTARNNGLLHASGEYIVFLDADDILTPSFLAVRVDFLNKNENVGF